jgi:hypothetical protein
MISWKMQILSVVYDPEQKKGVEVWQDVHPTKSPRPYEWADKEEAERCMGVYYPGIKSVGPDARVRVIEARE